MNLKKIIVAFFFAVSCNFSFGHEITSPQSTIDSAKIYYDLIAEENYQAYSRPNVIGMIAGGSLTVVGGGSCRVWTIRHIVQFKRSLRECCRECFRII